MTDLAREYGEGLYELCHEENLADDGLHQMQMLKNCFKEQPDFLRLGQPHLCAADGFAHCL